MLLIGQVYDASFFFNQLLSVAVEKQSNPGLLSTVDNEMGTGEICEYLLHMFCPTSDNVNLKGALSGNLDKPKLTAASLSEDWVPRTFWRFHYWQLAPI